jgi:hypothetical protein
MTTIKLSDFSIKGYKTFRGREGAGFNATLLLNGKEVAFMSDEGSGGELRIEWKEGYWKTPKDIAAFLASPEAVKIAIKREEAFRKEYGFGADKPLPTTWEQTDFAEYLVSQHEYDKDLKKVSKRYGFVFRPASGDPKDMLYYQVAKGYKWTAAELAKTEQQAKAKHGEIVVLARPEI